MTDRVGLSEASGHSPLRERRLYVSWYNRGGRSFPRDNGVRWFRIHMRLWRWREIGGLWWQVYPSWRFKVLLPDLAGVQTPPRHRSFR